MTHSADVYIHIRIMLGILQGLSMAILLNGLVRFIHHPKKHRVYLPHLLWALTLLFTLVDYWWSEMELGFLPQWTPTLYLFSVMYATAFYLGCAILFPGDIEDHGDYRSYFLSRRRWFFSLAITLQLLAALDVLIDGPFQTLIIDPALRQQNIHEQLVFSGICIALYGLLMYTKNSRLHHIGAAASLLFAIYDFVSSDS